MVYAARIPRYLQIADALRTRVRREGGRGTVRFPSEHALCAEFRVSRPTIRQALELLVEEGCLTRQRGRGTFVTTAPGGEGSLRVIGSIEDMIALGNETRYKPLDRGVVRAPAEVARALRLPPGSRAVRFVGVRHNDDGPFQHVTAYLPEALGRHLLEEDLGTTSLIATVERRLGIAMKFSEQLISAARAPKAVADLLGVRPRAPLLYFRRTYLGETGDPIEYAVSYQATARFPYRVVLSRTTRRG